MRQDGIRGRLGRRTDGRSALRSAGLVLRRRGCPTERAAAGRGGVDDPPREFVVVVVPLTLVGQPSAPCAHDAHDVFEEVDEYCGDGADLDDGGEADDGGVVDGDAQWPVEETGRNSVIPSTTPSTAAWPMLMTHMGSVSGWGGWGGGVAQGWRGWRRRRMDRPMRARHLPRPRCQARERRVAPSSVNSAS